MVDKIIIQKLALERCKVHVSHLCAMQHLLQQGGNDVADFNHLNGLFENLNRDLSLIENLIGEQ
jgi:hypothetical protein